LLNESQILRPDVSNIRMLRYTEPLRGIDGRLLPHLVKTLLLRQLPNESQILRPDVSIIRMLRYTEPLRGIDGRLLRIWSKRFSFGNCRRRSVLTKAGAVHRYREWLGVPEHADNTDVRTQYLAFVQQLPKEKRFDQMREQAAIDTAKWLGCTGACG